MLILMMLLGLNPVCWAAPETPPSVPTPVPVEDYPLYDAVVDEKFLTPETQLVLLERTTVTHLHPEQEGPLSVKTFDEYEIFDGRLPLDLVRDFVFKNQTPSKLESHFGFGVRYRFVAGDGTEQQETSLTPPIPVSWRLVPVQEPPFDGPPPVIDRLAFSRVAYTFGREDALVYVEYNRPDGSGAGFVVWFRQEKGQWGIFDSEVVWAGQPEARLGDPSM